MSEFVTVPQSEEQVSNSLRHSSLGVCIDKYILEFGQIYLKFGQMQFEFWTNTVNLSQSPSQEEQDSNSISHSSLSVCIDKYLLEFEQI